MNARFARRSAAWIVLVAMLAQSAILPVGAAATAPGTNITNTATATYTDANGVVYNTTSNTVTTIVQNAPTLTELPGAGSQYSPGQAVTDSFTITNTGNAAGKIHVNGNNTVDAGGNFSSSADATLGGADVASGTLGGGPTASAGCGSGASIYAVYVLSTTTTTYCDTIADLNTFLGTQSIPAAANNTITVTVYYKLAANAPTVGSPTITSTLYSSITYPAVAGAVAEVSALASGTESNTVVADAILNQYKTSSQCTASCPAGTNVGDVTYTVNATNGGQKDAKDIQSVKALLGPAWSSVNGGTDLGGVLLSDKVPAFGGTPLALSNTSGANWQVSVVTNTTYGFPATGAKAYVVYSTSATAATWAVAGGGPASGSTTTTFTIPTAAGTVYWVGVVIVHGTCPVGGAGFELCSYTTNATTNGNANVATYPGLQYAFTVAQPTGPGSANAGSMLNNADAVWGDNQPTEHVLGPSIAANTNDTTTSTPVTSGATGINYLGTTTPGSSNQTSNAAIASYATLTGPYDAAESGACPNAAGFTNCQGADATGTYDGVASSNGSDDFTAISFGAADQIVNTGTTAGTPVTATVTATSQSLCVKHSLFNDGNKNDSYNVAIGAQPNGYAIPTTSSPTAGSGWTFGIYSDNLCSSALGGSTQGATTTATAVSVNSNAAQVYYVKYSIPAGIPYFMRFDSAITATSNGTGSPSNTTHDELYSSFVALTKSANVTSTNCPAGALPGLPSSDPTGAKTCPGGTIAYTIDYRNLVMGTASTNASFAQVITKPAQFTATDDGAQSSSSSATVPNWAYFTTGLQTTPLDNDSNAAARGGANASVFTFWTNKPATGAGSGVFAAPGTKFVDQIGGATFQLAPKGYFTSSIAGNATLPVAEPAAIDWQGTITYSLIVT